MRRVRVKQPAPRHPTTISGWEKLLRRVITRVEKVDEAKAEGLRRALTEGRAEAVLRKMAIICETDIDREFPPKD